MNVFLGLVWIYPHVSSRVKKSVVHVVVTGVVWDCSRIVLVTILFHADFCIHCPDATVSHFTGRLVLSDLLPKTRVEVWTTLSATCPLLSTADLPSRALPPPFSLHFVSSYSKCLSSIDEWPCRSTNILTVSFCLSMGSCLLSMVSFNDLFRTTHKVKTQEVTRSRITMWGHWTETSG